MTATVTKSTAHWESVWWCFPACLSWLVVGVGAPSEASWSPQMRAVSQARCRAAHLEQVQLLAAPGLK